MANDKTNLNIKDSILLHPHFDLDLNLNTWCILSINQNYKLLHSEYVYIYLYGTALHIFLKVTLLSKPFFIFFNLMDFYNTDLSLKRDELPWLMFII